MTFSYWTLLGAVTPVFAIVAAGFLARRGGMLTAEADRSLLRVSVNLLYPCLIADSILANPALRNAANLLWPPLAGFFAVALGYAVAGATGGLFGLARGKQARTFAYTVGLFNYGYMAIPLAQSLFDRGTVGVLFTFNLGVEVALWLGVGLVLEGAASARDLRKIFNPPVLAILLSLALNACGARDWLPPFLPTTAHMMGATAVPLALLLTGATLCDLLGQAEPRGSLSIAAGACALRLGLLPALFVLLARWLPCPVELKRVLVIQAAMPAAMLPVILVRHSGGDTGTALTVVLVTTIFGLLTIPWWIQAGAVYAAF